MHISERIFHVHTMKTFSKLLSQHPMQNNIAHSIKFTWKRILENFVLATAHYANAPVRGMENIILNTLNESELYTPKLMPSILYFSHKVRMETLENERYVE